MLFGTDGVRGVANRDPMTPEAALRLGQVLVRHCTRGGERPRILIGKDTRLSGDMIESGLAAGVCSMGGDAILADVVPTPAVAVLTVQLRAAAGVVVSASHNVFSDNGIKIFGGDGFKLPDAAEHDLERQVLGELPDEERPIGSAVGRITHLGDSRDRYLAVLRAVLPAAPLLKGLRLVLDCANGATAELGPRLFADLAADLSIIGDAPDGININRNCGAVHPEALQRAVVRERAALGIALDGDGDRVILVDENGEVVDGDEILAILAADMLERGVLKQNTVVGTVMSNFGLERTLTVRGVRFVRTPVGDRHIVSELRRSGAALGGESSGHIVCLDYGTTGDGLVAGLLVAAHLAAQCRPLSELKRVVVKLPQVVVNVQVAVGSAAHETPTVRAVVRRVTLALYGRGRVLVRPSGTEPLVRVMVEGEDREEVTAFAEEIASAIKGHEGDGGGG